MVERHVLDWNTQLLKWHTQGVRNWNRWPELASLPAKVYLGRRHASISQDRLHLCETDPGEDPLALA